MKTAIITGAAQNIGKGIAVSLLNAGYTCVLLDKNEPKLHETAEELKNYGECREYVFNIANTKAIEQFLDWLDKESIEVNALVNNVGYDSGESVLGLTSEQTRLSNQTNTEGPFYLTSLIAKRLVDNKGQGNIIFISSTHSQVIRTHPLYSSSKAALEMFVKEAALELAAHGIRVNAIAPGIVEDTDKPKENDLVPLGANQQPIDIGEATVFLLSDKARFITGQTLVVDGGFSLTHTHYWIKNNKL